MRSELRYPDAIGAWPAVVLFLAFVWMELVWEHSDSPAYLAAAMLAYSALTWLGMLLFGRAQWLRRGEVFTLVFGLLARFAPTEVRDSGAGGRALYLRPWGVGLLSREPVPASIVVLVLAMLAAVCFDGFMETPLWAGILEYYAPSAQSLEGDGDATRAWVQTAGVIGAPLLFVAVYLVFCRADRLVRGCAGSGRTRGGPVRADARTDCNCLPSRALPFVSRDGRAIPDSACLRSVRIRLELVRHQEPLHQDRTGRRSRRLVHCDRRHRHGHIVAVYLAHCVALKANSDRRAALRSQWPMVALMVCYTMTSLWIIAQPIVTTR